jgi:hypothetical protein
MNVPHSVFLFATVGALSAAVTACGGGEVAVQGTAPGVAVEAPPAEVVVATRPPPEQVEVIPVAPSVNHIWIKGHWHWDGAAWIWRPGHYEVRRVGLQWYPAHYAERGGGIVYVPGHWGR